MDEQTKNKNKNLLIPSLKADRKMNIVQKRRAFLFSSRKNRGSMTVEASMVLPVFLFFMMTLLMGIEMVRLQSNLFAGLGSSEAIHMEKQIQRALQDQPLLGHFNVDAAEEYLNGQENGRLCLLGNISVRNQSDVQENGRIEVEVQYQIKPFIYWLPIGNSNGGYALRMNFSCMILMDIVDRSKEIEERKKKLFISQKTVPAITPIPAAYPSGYLFRQCIAAGYPQ